MSARGAGAGRTRPPQASARGASTRGASSAASARGAGPRSAGARSAGARGASARGALGRYGEDLAARRLHESGIVVLERNWRCRAGEIDIVARDGDALVMCEVKTRRLGAYEHPMAAVTPRKAERLRRLAAQWLAERWLVRFGKPPTGGVRIDLIGVLLPERGAPIVRHAKGVA